MKEGIILAASNNVTATISTKGDKYYVIITYYLDGKRKQKWEPTGLSVSGRNKRKAEAQRKELEIEYQNRLSVAASQISFSEFMKQWLERTRGSISSSTFYEYE